MMKKLSIISIAILLVFLFVSSVSAVGVGLSLDGEVKSDNLDIIDGRTLLSGEVLENMGFEVSSQSGVTTVKNEEVSFEFELDTNKVQVNDIEIELDAKSFEKDGEVYLPLRFVLETLGYEIKWDGKNKRVSAEKTEIISYPVTIEGGEVTYTVGNEPETVVSLAPSVTETLFALGAGDKVKGRTQYCNYPEAVNDIANLGNMTDPSIEMIVDINPDMVIAATHYKPEVLNKLKEAGIEVIAKPSPQSIDGMYEYTLKLGAIMNKNYEARALVSSMKAKVQSVAMNLKATDKRPSAYYIVGTGQWGEYTGGSDTYISEFIQMTGGKNVADDVEGWKYSLEKLIDNDPQIILGPESDIETMKTSPNYQGLTAIQEGNYAVVDRDIFSSPSPRLINQGLKIILEIFHGDIAGELNF